MYPIDFSMMIISSELNCNIWRNLMAYIVYTLFFGHPFATAASTCLTKVDIRVTKVDKDYEGRQSLYKSLSFKDLSFR